MKVTVTVKNTSRNKILAHCCMGKHYEQVGNNVTILYYDRATAEEDMDEWQGEFTIDDGWFLVDIETGKEYYSY